MADEVTKPRPLGEEEVQDIQITLKSDANAMSIRELRVSVEFGINYLSSVCAVVVARKLFTSA